MEFVAGALAWLVFVGVMSIHLRVRKAKEEAEYIRMLNDDADKSVVFERVNDIMLRCHIDLERQHATAYGPWITSLLDGGNDFSMYLDSRGGVRVERQHRNISPKVAITAVRMTIKDILETPLSYDKDGREMPHRVIDLGTLYAAERELLEMGA